MTGIVEWARDLLVSRGALVEDDREDAIRALLPPEVAGALSASDWLSLNFASGPGADDPAEWLDRLESLLPADRLVVGARLRSFVSAPPVDHAAVLANEFVVQNGVYRLLEEGPAYASYFLFTVQYTVESDDRSIGVFTVCLNSSAGSLVPQPTSLLRAVADSLEDEPAFRAPAEEIRRLYGQAIRSAQAEVRGRVGPLEESANRRLARDVERVEAYYAGLVAQAEKRSGRRAGKPSTDASAAEKDRARLESIALDRAAKLEDLYRKYSLRIRFDLAGALVFRLPVREIAVRLIRKKEERRRVLHWNPAIRSLEPLLCEHCGGRAHPLYLCEKVHCLCQDCWCACARCGRHFCRRCQPRCKCEAAVP